MAARLEIKGQEILLGPFCVGRVVTNKRERTHHGIVQACGKWPVEETPYQSEEDCREAGMEVEP
jgi:hypothetical protein